MEVENGIGTQDVDGVAQRESLVERASESADADGGIDSYRSASAAADASPPSSAATTPRYGSVSSGTNRSGSSSLPIGLGPGDIN